jgi:hypothetical protein
MAMIDYSELFEKDKLKDSMSKKPSRSRLVISILCGVIVFLLLTLLTFKKHQAKVEEVAPEQSVVVDKPEAKSDSNVPTQEQAIDAAIRAHDRATKVCYDPAIEGFLFQYPFKEPDEKTEYFHGWYYLKYQQMWKTDNGIWFMKDNNASEYVKVYPDVTNLNCKNT